MRVITLCLVCLAAAAVSNPVKAQDYKLAMGLRFSTAAPSLSNSVSIKYCMDDVNAIEGLVSFGSRFAVGALYEKQQIIGGTPAFKWFYGAGGYVGFEDRTTYIGPTGIVGLDYKFQDAPINLSIDWKPELDIVPKINFVPGAFGISVRYTF